MGTRAGKLGRLLQLALVASLPIWFMGQSATGGGCGNATIVEESTVGDEPTGEVSLVIFPGDLDTDEVVFELDAENRLEAAVFGSPETVKAFWEFQVGSSASSLISSIEAPPLNPAQSDVFSTCSNDQLPFGNCEGEDSDSDSSGLPRVWGTEGIDFFIAVAFAAGDGSALTVFPSSALSLQGLDDQVSVCAATEACINDGKTPCECCDEGASSCDRKPVRLVLDTSDELDNQLTLNECGKAEYDLKTDKCKPRSSGESGRGCIGLRSCYNESSGQCRIIATDTRTDVTKIESYQVPLFTPGLGNFIISERPLLPVHAARCQLGILEGIQAEDGSNLFESGDPPTDEEIEQFLSYYNFSDITTIMKPLAPYMALCGLPQCAAQLSEVENVRGLPAGIFSDDTCVDEYAALSLTEKINTKICLDQITPHVCNCMETGGRDRIVFDDSSATPEAGSVAQCCLHGIKLIIGFALNPGYVPDFGNTLCEPGVREIRGGDDGPREVIRRDG